jgi:hypothetical protein
MKKKKKRIAAGWGIFLAVLPLGHFLTGTMFVLHLNIETSQMSSLVGT